MVARGSSKLIDVEDILIVYEKRKTGIYADLQSWGVTAVEGVECRESTWNLETDVLDLNRNSINYLLCLCHVLAVRHGTIYLTFLCLHTHLYYTKIFLIAFCEDYVS